MFPPLPYRIGSRFQASVYIPEVLECQLQLSKDPNGPGTSAEKSIFSCPTNTATTIEVEIQGWVRASTNHKAQLLTVSMEKPLPGTVHPTWAKAPQTGIVAKLFDPCYPKTTLISPSSDNSNLKQQEAEKRFIADARVYQALADLQGTEIPKFYGSYSVSLPMRQDLSAQNVRMILIGLIQGVDMSELDDPYVLPQRLRQKVIRDIVDLESRIYARDIKFPLQLRNVMLTGHESSVVFIDFERAVFSYHGNGIPSSSSMEVVRRKPQQLQGQYISPLLRWAPPPRFLVGWVDWEWPLWIQQEFGHTEEAITAEMRQSMWMLG